MPTSVQKRHSECLPNQLNPQGPSLHQRIDKKIQRKRTTPRPKKPKTIRLKTTNSTLNEHFEHVKKKGINYFEINKI
jgi:hypothetical protein